VSSEPRNDKHGRMRPTRMTREKGSKRV
jgi:hypothetical protein